MLVVIGGLILLSGIYYLLIGSVHPTVLANLHYGVSVKNVTVLNVKGKVKRNMRGVSKKPSWKKAYVRLEDGHDIDFSSQPSS